MIIRPKGAVMSGADVNERDDLMCATSLTHRQGAHAPRFFADHEEPADTPTRFRAVISWSRSIPERPATGAVPPARAPYVLAPPAVVSRKWGRAGLRPRSASRAG